MYGGKVSRLVLDLVFRLGARRKLYSKYGVKEYWIVDFEKRTVEVHLLHGQMLQLRALLNEEDELRSSVLPGYGCKVETIFSI